MHRVNEYKTHAVGGSGQCQGEGSRAKAQEVLAGGGGWVESLDRRLGEAIWRGDTWVKTWSEQLAMSMTEGRVIQVKGPPFPRSWSRKGPVCLQNSEETYEAGKAWTESARDLRREGGGGDRKALWTESHGSVLSQGAAWRAFRFHRAKARIVKNTAGAGGSSAEGDWIWSLKQPCEITVITPLPCNFIDEYCKGEFFFKKSQDWHADIKCAYDKNANFTKQTLQFIQRKSQRQFCSSRRMEWMTNGANLLF